MPKQKPITLKLQDKRLAKARQLCTLHAAYDKHTRGKVYAWDSQCLCAGCGAPLSGNEDFDEVKQGSALKRVSTDIEAATELFRDYDDYSVHHAILAKPVTGLVALETILGYKCQDDHDTLEKVMFVKGGLLKLKGKVAFEPEVEAHILKYAATQPSAVYLWSKHFRGGPWPEGYAALLKAVCPGPTDVSQRESRKTTRQAACAALAYCLEYNVVPGRGDASRIRARLVSLHDKEALSTLTGTFTKNSLKFKDLDTKYKSYYLAKAKLPAVFNDVKYMDNKIGDEALLAAMYYRDTGKRLRTSKEDGDTETLICKFITQAPPAANTVTEFQAAMLKGDRLAMIAAHGAAGADDALVMVCNTLAEYEQAVITELGHGPITDIRTKLDEEYHFKKPEDDDD
jgi:hypothetical protein